MITFMLLQTCKVSLSTTQCNWLIDWVVFYVSAMFQPFNGGGNTKIYGVFKHFIFGDAPADPNIFFSTTPCIYFNLSHTLMYCLCDNPRLYHTGRPKYFIKHLLLLIQSLASTLQWPCYLDLSIQSFAFVNDKYISWKRNVVWGKSRWNVIALWRLKLCLLKAIWM